MSEISKLIHEIEIAANTVNTTEDAAIAVFVEYVDERLTMISNELWG
jgi:hypothetical protein